MFCSVPPKRLSMYRLTPADHRQLFSTALTNAALSTLSASNSAANSAVWQVGQLLASIQSINSSVLSYVPLNLSTFSSFSSPSSSSSTRSYLHMTELSSSVLYLDEGVDTIIGCEAIGGKWKPLFCFLWQSAALW